MGAVNWKCLNCFLLGVDTSPKPSSVPSFSYQTLSFPLLSYVRFDSTSPFLLEVVLVLVQCPWENITLPHYFMRRNSLLCREGIIPGGDWRSTFSPFSSRTCVPGEECGFPWLLFRVPLSFSSCLAFPSQKALGLKQSIQDKASACPGV